MKSYTTPEFWDFYDGLPEEIQALANKAYDLWSENPYYPSLQFKKLKGTKDWYSVRINENWRAVGYLKDDGITWVWIGSHSDYNHLIRNL